MAVISWDVLKLDDEFYIAFSNQDVKGSFE